MAKITNDRSRAGNGTPETVEVSKRATKEELENWATEPEKGTAAGQNEYYDPENDRYVSIKRKRRKIKVSVVGTKPEISEKFLKKILKKISEEYGDLKLPCSEVPVAIRFHLHEVYPGDEKHAKWAYKGYYYPYGYDLRAWSDFIFEGLQGYLYEDKNQIVCCGSEAVYSALPGIAIEAYILWEFIDTVAYKLKRGR